MTPNDPRRAYVARPPVSIPRPDQGPPLPMGPHLAHAGPAHAMPHQRAMVDDRQPTATFDRPAPTTIKGPNFVNSLSLDGQYVITNVLVQPNTTHKMNLGVFVVKHRVTGRVYVEKRLDKSTQAAWERVYQEVHILKRINLEPGGDKPCLNWMNHDTFGYRGTTTTALYLEHCDQGNLGQYITSRCHTGRMCLEQWVWATIWSISRALCWMHWGIVDLNDRPSRQAMEKWNTISHLDIKPDNIFLKLDKSTASCRQNPGGIFQIMLGDFGCAVEAKKVGDVQDEYVQAHGTRGWFPPENQHSELYDTRDLPYYGRKTDIWQVGGVIQCMMALKNFPRQEVTEDGHPAFDGYSDELVCEMKTLMNRDWMQRPEAVEMAEAIKMDMHILGMPFKFGP